MKTSVKLNKGKVGVIQRRRAAVSVSTLRNDVKRSVREK